MPWAVSARSQNLASGCLSYCRQSWVPWFGSGGYRPRGLNAGAGVGRLRPHECMRPPAGSLGRPEHRQDRLADLRGQGWPGLDHAITLTAPHSDAGRRGSDLAVTAPERPRRWPGSPCGWLGAASARPRSPGPTRGRVVSFWMATDRCSVALTAGVMTPASGV